MKDIFDPKRFGRYFAYELNTARQNCGLSLLVTCALPLIAILLELIFTADINVNGESVGFRWFLAMVAVAIMTIAFPVKVYGSVTDRRAGSWWALIPVSSFEKFLSVVLMTCVVLPVCFFGLYSAVDALVCLIPGYGEPLIAQLSELKASAFLSYTEYSTSGLIFDLWASWCASVLTFTLGAIFFRKGKASKTILVIIAFGILFSSIFVWVVSGMEFEDFCSMEFPVGIRALTIIIQTVINVILLTGIFFRIKTIKY
jgi:hypothetical protein